MVLDQQEYEELLQLLLKYVPCEVDLAYQVLCFFVDHSRVDYLISKASKEKHIDIISGVIRKGQRDESP